MGAAAYAGLNHPAVASQVLQQAAKRWVLGGRAAMPNGKWLLGVEPPHSAAEGQLMYAADMGCDPSRCDALLACLRDRLLSPNATQYPLAFHAYLLGWGGLCCLISQHSTARAVADFVQRLLTLDGQEAPRPSRINSVLYAGLHALTPTDGGGGNGNGNGNNDDGIGGDGVTAAASAAAAAPLSPSPSTAEDTGRTQAAVAAAGQPDSRCLRAAAVARMFRGILRLSKPGFYFPIMLTVCQTYRDWSTVGHILGVWQATLRDEEGMGTYRSEFHRIRAEHTVQCETSTRRTGGTADDAASSLGSDPAVVRRVFRDYSAAVVIALRSHCTVHCAKAVLSLLRWLSSCGVLQGEAAVAVARCDVRRALPSVEALMAHPVCNTVLAAAMPLLQESVPDAVLADVRASSPPPPPYYQPPPPPSFIPGSVCADLEPSAAVAVVRLHLLLNTSPAAEPALRAAVVAASGGFTLQAGADSPPDAAASTVSSHSAPAAPVATTAAASLPVAAAARGSGEQPLQACVGLGEERPLASPLGDLRGLLGETLSSVFEEDSGRVQ